METEPNNTVKTFVFERKGIGLSRAYDISTETRIITVYWRYENPMEKDDNIIRTELERKAIFIAELMDRDEDNSNTKENPYIITDELYNTYKEKQDAKDADEKKDKGSKRRR